MKLIPTKAQWKKWGLPSKASYVGCVVGVFGILLTVVLTIFANITDIQIPGEITENTSDNVPTPLFELFVNDISSPIHDHAVIKLAENRAVRIRVQNIGKIAADNLSVSVYVPLESSNLAFDNWTKQAPPINPKTSQEVTDLLHLWSVAAGVVPENGWFRSPVLSISKDLPGPEFTRRALEELGFEFSGSASSCPEDFVFHVLPVIVSVNSSQSIDHRYNLFFTY